jgi:myo-inositol-hexaphosphate 3-phosphohydrolase
MRAMKLRMTALNTARKNLEQIEMHAADHEQNAVRNITDADVVVFSSAVKVFTVAFIASGMKSPDDIAFTQRQFGLLARSLVTTADEELTQLNANLPNIAAPTAVLEATNIRDAVVDLRDILKPFVAQE